MPCTCQEINTVIVNSVGILYVHMGFKTKMNCNIVVTFSKYDNPEHGVKHCLPMNQTELMVGLKYFHRDAIKVTTKGCYCCNETVYYLPNVKPTG